jgi:glycosyltransferase involved in cell wall biosynthesis
MSTILTLVPDAKTRVTFVAQNYAPEPSGNAPYTTDLAEGLSQRGWQVRVVSGYPSYPAWRVFPGFFGWAMEESLNGVEVKRLRSYIPQKPTLIRRLTMELSFGFRSIFSSWNDPDVIVMVSPSLFAVWLAQRKARLIRNRPPVLVWVQDLYSKGASETGDVGGFGVRLIVAIERTVLAQADRVVAIHDRFKRHMVGELRIAAHSISVVRNWTHIKPTSLNGLEFRTKFAWRDDEIVVLHAGNMGSKQGLENVVEAARLADDANAPVRFVLLGGGNQRDALIALATGVRRIDFMESLSDVDFQGAMAAADVLLVNESAGVTEMSVPSKLTSYFAANRPVLAATDTGSITADEIALAGAGIRVDADAPDQLLAEALALGADPVRASAYSIAGLRYQQEALDRDPAVDRYAAILREVISNRRTPRPPSRTRSFE